MAETGLEGGQGRENQPRVLPIFRSSSLWDFTTLILWFHVAAVVLWVGGLLFEFITLFPVLHREDNAASTRLMATVEQRFRVVAWGAVLLLVASGMFNIFNRMGVGGFSDTFMPVLALKVAALIVMVVLQHVRSAVFVPRMLATGGSSDETALKNARSARSACGYLVLAQLLVALATVYLGLALRRY